MLPQHVINFVTQEIEKRQIKSDNTLAEYGKQLAEYKALSRFKRFFSNNPETDSWDFDQYRINQLKEIKREARYKHKMDYMRMEIPVWWHYSFYRWAEANKIPF